MFVSWSVTHKTHTRMRARTRTYTRLLSSSSSPSSFLLPPHLFLHFSLSSFYFPILFLPSFRIFTSLFVSSRLLSIPLPSSFSPCFIPFSFSILPSPSDARSLHFPSSIPYPFFPPLLSCFPSLKDTHLSLSSLSSNLSFLLLLLNSNSSFLSSFTSSSTLLFSFPFSSSTSHSECACAEAINKRVNPHIPKQTSAVIHGWRASLKSTSVMQACVCAGGMDGEREG